MLHQDQDTPKSIKFVSTKHQLFFCQINALIEDLGLSQVKHTRVKDLTTSERQRLNVACHLLLDADIVVLDQGWDSMLL